MVRVFGSLNIYSIRLFGAYLIVYQFLSVNLGDRTTVYWRLFWIVNLSINAGQGCRTYTHLHL